MVGRSSCALACDVDDDAVTLAREPQLASASMNSTRSLIHRSF
jgi:hypothetical protein